MIRSELKTLAKALLNERGDYFAANIDVLCDLANRIVYGKVAQLDPEQLDEYASFTYPADAEFVALTGPTYLNERPLRVLGVDELSSSAYTVDSSETATPLYQFNPGHASGRTGGPRWGLAQGHSLHVKPVPGEALYLRVRYIPEVLPMTLDSDTLLDTHAYDYHDIVLAVLVKLLRTVEAGESWRGEKFEQWLTNEIIGNTQARQNDYTFPVDDAY